MGRKVLPLTMGIYGSRKYLASAEPKHLILSSSLKKRPAWAQEMFPEAPIALRIDSIVTQHEAVRQGLGVARLPCFEGDSDKSLRRLDVEAPSEWAVWVLHHADLRATARVRAAREFFYEVLESKRALIEGELSQWWEGGNQDEHALTQGRSIAAPAGGRTLLVLEAQGLLDRTRGRPVRIA